MTTKKKTETKEEKKIVKPKKITLTPAITKDIKKIKVLLDGETAYKKLIEGAKKSATIYMRGGLGVEGYKLAAKAGTWTFKTSVTLKKLHAAFKRIIPLQSDYIELKSVATFKKYCAGSEEHLDKLQEFIIQGTNESKCTKAK
jgi:hypothetical protein